MTAEKTSLRCKHCNKKFKYNSERKRHEKSHSQQFGCKVCSKSFSFVSALRRHEKQHERTGSVQCDKCSKTFRDYPLLKRHIKYAHGGKYSCTKCESTFSSESALKVHMKTHKVLSERKYRCSIEGCTKAFNFTHHLKHHELTHTNNKQYFCAVCGKGFIQSHHLKTHLKTHDPNISLYCTFTGCTKKFATEYARKRHLVKHQNKTDSGISSESNSVSETSIQSNDVNGIIVSSLLKNEQLNDEVNIVNLIKITYGPEDLSRRKVKDIETLIKAPEKNIISDCKSVIGECIMKEKGEGCVCEQISDSVTENFDFTPIEESTKSNKLSLDDIQFPNPCEGCACSKDCEVLPEIEYRLDGTVKIMKNFDVDLDFQEVEKCAKTDTTFVPYNSCKDVLGNCIVSGNGTIGEGCLCAKMALEEQATAQEIEDITPHPNGELHV